jgi:hypothetical protein
MYAPDSNLFDRMRQLEVNKRFRGYHHKNPDSESSLPPSVILLRSGEKVLGVPSNFLVFALARFHR